MGELLGRLGKLLAPLKSQQCLLLLWAGASLGKLGQGRRPGAGPHLDGPGPRVVEGGPRGAPVASLLAGGLAVGGLPAVLLLS